jgi:predicted Zn finger-like uncharacterized protein
MILNCSNCGARFAVDPAAVGPAGRRVRCGRCRHEWWARAATPAQAQPVDFSAAERIEARPIPPGSNLPALRAEPRRDGPIFGWLLLSLVFGAIAIMALGRDEIMARYPWTHTLYARFGFATPPPGAGLVIAEVEHSSETDAGAAVLVIEGNIVNLTRFVRDVPRLRAALLDDNDLEIYSWTFQPDEPRLEAGDRATFRSAIRPPERAFARVAITFVARER